jgi:hypothetical protein
VKNNIHFKEKYSMANFELFWKMAMFSNALSAKVVESNL